MTDTLRSTTLRLRRPAVRDAAITRPKSAAAVTVRASTAAVVPDANGERQLRSDTLLQGRSHVSIQTRRNPLTVVVFTCWPSVGRPCGQRRSAHRANGPAP